MYTSYLHTAAVALGLAALFLIGSRYYRRYPLPVTLSSLAEGLWGYMGLGVIGAFLLSPDYLSLDDGSLFRGCIGIGLMWIGFQAGLEMDFRLLGERVLRRVGLDLLRLALGFSLAFLVGMLFLPAVGPLLGLAEPFGPVALLGAAIAVCARPSGYYGLGTGAPRHPRPSVSGLLAGPVAILLYTAIAPVFPADALYRFGPLLVFGYGRTVGMTVVLGLLLGVIIDFAFRAHRDGYRGIFIALGAIAAVSGPCLALDLPAMGVGLLAGIWVINTTVRKREMQELVETTGSGILAVFGALAGSALVVSQRANPGEARAALAIAGGLLALRAVSRALSSVGVLTLERKPAPLLRVLGYSWAPLGLVAIGFVLQGLIVAEPPLSASLAAGALFAILFTQALVLPRKAVAADEDPLT